MQVIIGRLNNQSINLINHSLKNIFYMNGQKLNSLKTTLFLWNKVNRTIQTKIIVKVFVEKVYFGFDFEDIFKDS